MPKHILLATLCCAVHVAGATELTALETRWLGAAAPVLAYSQSLKLPIDIIVQPRSGPGTVPLAMGFDAGRCKLVLSLRGNADAEAILQAVPDSERGELIEAMAAHEVGHCWRYVQGAWHSLPAGFTEVGEESADDASLLAAARAMRENRREEGFADLVALAWTQHRHPTAYARVYRWLESVRRDPPVARNTHDTRAWVRLASDASAFGAASSPFDDVASLWRRGLLSED